MKRVKFGSMDISKMICGTNTFYGKSHSSNARDREYSNRFSGEYIEKTIRFCIEKGINAVETSANERIYRMISKVRNDSILHFIGTTRIDNTSEMNSHEEKLDYLIRSKAGVCIIHSQFVDEPGNANMINGLDMMVEKVRAAGLMVGVSTHRISTVELCERRYDIDVYLFPLNKTGFVYPGYDGKEKVQDRVDIVKGIDKPFILMKTLAAGRLSPDEGLHFALENSKEKDIITVGIGSIEEADELVGIVDAYYK